ncbi:MAG: TonB-dependent receptor [Planctomycetes bacterium]|nr:TonB-dependent receptor [Planctomycetota bacterium]
MKDMTMVTVCLLIMAGFCYPAIAGEAADEETPAEESAVDEEVSEDETDEDSEEESSEEESPEESETTPVESEEEMEEPSEESSEDRAEYNLASESVTAARSGFNAFNLPRSTNLVNKTRMDNEQWGVALDRLSHSPGIWLERRGSTTSTLVMRGLSGRNVLATVNGHSLTTLWGEGADGGDDQYGKVDPYSVERIEVIRGPMSVLYGSGAMGGVINFVTNEIPIDYTPGGFEMGGRTRLSYGTNANEQRFRQEAFGATDFFRFHLGGTYASVGDIQGGRDRGVLDPTSGRDKNFDGAFEFKLADGMYLDASIQQVRRRNQHRFYRPFQSNDNDWFSYQTHLTIEDLGDFVEKIHVGASYQYKEETRYWMNGDTQGTQLYGALVNPTGVAKTTTINPGVRVHLRFGESHKTILGWDLEYDVGESPDDEEFTYSANGLKVKASPDATWYGNGFYVQHEWTIGGGLSMQGSARYDSFHYKTDPDVYADRQPGSSLDLLEISNNTNAIVGAIGASYEFAADQLVYGSFSRGFRERSPSFSLAQVGQGWRVPSQADDPIYSYTWEVGYRWDLEDSWGTVDFWRTRFDGFSEDSIPGTYQGQSYYDFDGDGTNDQVLVLHSQGWAYVYGIEAEGNLRLNTLTDSVDDTWVLRGMFDYSIGVEQHREGKSNPSRVDPDQYTTNGGFRTPIRFTQPARGVIALRMGDPEMNGFWMEPLVEMVYRYTRAPQSRIHADPSYRTDPDVYDDPAAFGQTTPRLIRKDGELPGYSVLNFRYGYRFNENVRVNGYVNNIANVEYRRAHSRAPAMGTDIGLEIVIDY